MCTQNARFELILLLRAGTVSPYDSQLVTSSSAASAGSRAMKTLRSWGLDIDEAHFMAGAPKGPLLDKIKPHLFFDDQVRKLLNIQQLFMLSGG